MTSRRWFLGAAAALASFPDTLNGAPDGNDETPDPSREKPAQVFKAEMWGSIQVYDLGGEENCSLRVTDYTPNDSPVLADVALATPAGRANFGLEREETEELVDALSEVLENAEEPDR